MAQISNYPLGGARCCRRLERSVRPGFFRALSDPTRLELLVQLAGCRRPCTVGELAGCCAVDLSVVSRHLAVLRDAGLLDANKKGRRVYYAVRYAEVARSLRDVANAVDECCPEGSCC